MYYKNCRPFEIDTNNSNSAFHIQYENDVQGLFVELYRVSTWKGLERSKLVQLLIHFLHKGGYIIWL